MCHFDRFERFEKIMLTRLSLLRSVFGHRKPEQLGNIKAGLVTAVTKVEHECLRELSSAARLSGDLQVALNFVVRAQDLDSTPSADITRELAMILWQQSEQKVAIDLLRDLETTFNGSDVNEGLQKARVLAQIVSSVASVLFMSHIR
jgi:serine-protein kinase ATM